MLNNQGVLNNYIGGTYINSGMLTNSGTVNNYGYLETASSLNNIVGGTLNNYAGGTLTNDHNGGLYNDGTLNNSGTLNNYADLRTAGTLNNSGTLNNYAPGSEDSFRSPRLTTCRRQPTTPARSTTRHLQQRRRDQQFWAC